MWNLTAIATGIIENKSNALLVYPNPAKNLLHFDVNINNTTVQIFDVTGKTLQTTNNNSTKFTVSLDNFDNGIYFYSITDNNNTIIGTNRFIVAK